MAVNCPQCATRMRVVHTERKGEDTDRWYRCPECRESVRTRESLLVEVQKRNPKGSEHPNSVLTEDDVRALRAERANGIPINQLATKYGLHRGTIINIDKYRAWKHVQ